MRSRPQGVSVTPTLEEPPYVAAWLTVIFSFALALQLAKKEVAGLCDSWHDACPLVVPHRLGGGNAAGSLSFVAVRPVGCRTVGTEHTHTHTPPCPEFSGSGAQPR